MMYIYNRILFAIKRNEVLAYTTKQMNFEYRMLNEKARQKVPLSYDTIDMQYL